MTRLWQLLIYNCKDIYMYMYSYIFCMMFNNFKMFMFVIYDYRRESDYLIKKNKVQFSL